MSIASYFPQDPTQVDFMTLLTLSKIFGPGLTLFRTVYLYQQKHFRSYGKI